MSKVNKNHVDWYNKNYYSESDPNFTSWSLRLLEEIKTQDLSNKKILDLGCGEAKILSYLYNNKKILPINLYGIDQSDKAIDIALKSIPNGNFVAGDINQLNYQDNFFEYIFLLETIEHLENPETVLSEISRTIKKGGSFYLSFPNYFNLPWLLVRVLSEVLNKPNWIVLQPVDKIYNIFQIIDKVEKHGFKKEKIFGTCYFPPIIYKYENLIISKYLDRLGLYFLAFHPVIKFIKK